MQNSASDIIGLAKDATAHLSHEDVMQAFDHIVILLSAPRSGSTLLFEQLAKQKEIWTIGGESHAIFRAFPHLRAQNAQLDSMALGVAHADEQTQDLFRRCFLYGLCNYEGTPLLSLSREDWPEQITIVEKTPRNALNIPFLCVVFPKAKFIYLYRDPRQTVASLMEAWSVGLKSGRFVTFRNLPDWHLPGWCFVLPPGWQQLRGKSVTEITAFQWVLSNQVIMYDLASVPTDRWVAVRYSDMVENMPKALTAIFTALSLRTEDATERGSGSDVAPEQALPLSRTTLSDPHKDKWKRFESHINPFLAPLMETFFRIEKFAEGQ